MANTKRIPKNCPACGGVLHVQTMCCDECDTRIEGSFPLPPLMQLSEEDQQFALDFILCSGSLKEMAANLKLSYPSVRNRLDDIIAILKEKHFENSI